MLAHARNCRVYSNVTDNAYVYRRRCRQGVQAWRLGGLSTGRRGWNSVRRCRLHATFIAGETTVLYRRWWRGGRPFFFGRSTHDARDPAARRNNIIVTRCVCYVSTTFTPLLPIVKNVFLIVLFWKTYDTN